MSEERISEERPLRVCDVCGQVDDHPRHMVGHAPGVVPVNNDLLIKVAAMDLPEDVKRAIMADVADTTQEQRHIDCCREVGCILPPSDPASCYNRPTGVRGGELLAAIQSGA